MTTNSAALILKVRSLVRDASSIAFSDDDVDYQLSAGFGYVTYGNGDETSSNTFQSALAQLYAGAQLSLSLARDRTKLLKWKSATGEEVNADEESKSLIKVAESWMKQVDSALERELKMKTDDVKTVASAKGADFTFNSDVPMHSDYKPVGVVGRLNRPSDR